MRITQGTFAFLPDFSDEEIEAQIGYAIRNGWAISIEHTDEPHPRNPYWDMWGHPLFDLQPAEIETAMREVRACREAFPREYIKLTACDSRLGRQTTAFSVIVNRPLDEPGFRLDRTESHDRVVRYGLSPYAASEPAGRRYGGSFAP